MVAQPCRTDGSISPRLFSKVKIIFFVIDSSIVNQNVDRCSFFNFGNEFVIVCGICDVKYVIRAMFPEFFGGFF